MLEELQEQIKKVKVVSFDIFDTLITRLVGRPETVFDLMGEHFGIKDFKNIRMSMQAQCGLELIKSHNYPHANMKEIYDYIKEHSDIKNIDELMEYEEKLEKQLLYQNKKIYEVYKFAKENGKRVVATSDMYLEMSFIKDVLDNCGYKDLDKIYLSSTERKAKFTGDLYDVLIKEEDVAPEEILHIGDNYKDDYQIAKDKGLQVYRYTETIIDKKTDNIAISFHNGIVRYVALQTNNIWEKVGAKGGLLYTGLYKQLLENVKDKIYFLARDGYNLYHIFKEFSKDRESEYVYTSRRALLLAGITKIDEESLNILPPFTLGQTVEEVLQYISMDKIFNEEDLQKVELNSFSDKIMTLDDITKVKKLYSLKEKEVLEVCAKERENCKKYFAKIGMLETDNYAFDCGWNGSSQYLLDRFFKSISKDINNKFYYAGIFDNEKSRKQLENSDFDAYLFSFDKNQEIVPKLQIAIAVVELFFGAPHNSVLKYSEDGYVFDKIEKEIDYKKDILKGLISYMKVALPTFKEFNINFDETAVLETIEDFIENPTDEEAVTIGNLNNVDGFAYQKGEEKHIAYLTEEQLEENENIEIYWPQAVLRRKDISDKVKDFVRNKYGLFEEARVEEVNKSSYLQRFKNSLRNNGYRTTLYLLKRKVKNKLFKEDEYQHWIKKQKEIKKEEFTYKPLISFVVPVYNAVKDQLVECIDSVFAQTYSNWQLILVDDASTLEETKDVLKSYEGKDERLKIRYHQTNGHISKTTNDGIEIADGEFIALLDNDDVLDKNALFEMIKKLNEDDYDFIYSDEDKLTEDGTKRHSPFFKPDYSKDTFMSLMYTCHFAIFRKSIVDKIGGFTVGLDGAQDYDFVLRFTEKTNKIGHVPKILYHWREREGSIASSPKAKEYALDAIVSLKEQYLQRHNLKGKVVYEDSVFQYRVVYEALEKSVDVLINFSNLENTKKCIDNLKKKSVALNKIIILADENDKKQLEEELKDYKIYNKKDFKDIKNNCSELVLFIDDKISLDSKSLDVLAGHAALSHVGMVGPKILYQDSSIIYSCGLSSKEPFHVLGEADDNGLHYYCRNRLDYNTLAVSPMCLMIKTELLNNLEFLNSINKTIEFGNELYHKQYYSVVRNDAYAYIERKDVPKNQDLVKRIYDPFINPNIEVYKFAIANFKEKTTKVKKGKYHSRPIKDITYQINYDIKKDYIHFKGFALDEDILHNNSNKITIVLKNEDRVYLLNTKKIYDDFVSLHYQKNYNFTNFYAKVKSAKIEKGNYEILMYIDNKLDKEKVESKILGTIKI